MSEPAIDATALNEPVITVFTATYNRAHTLVRTYESLVAQSFRDFEWLIIDDGSVDNTAEVVARWQQEADFPIRYHFQENSGMYAALDCGASLARGKFFVPLDSDGRCLPNALERLLERWNEIPVEEQSRYTGICALCVDQHGVPVGKDFAHDPTDATLLEMIYVHGVKNETFRLLRTEVMRAFPFPDLPGVKYMPESVAVERAARHLTTRYVNDRLRIYYRNEGDDNTSGTGTMSLRRISRMAPGLGYWHRQILLTQMDYFRHAPRRFLLSALHFVRFSWLNGRGIRRQWNDLPAVSARLLWLVAIVPGSALYLRDRFLLPKK